MFETFDTLMYSYFTNSKLITTCLNGQGVGRWTNNPEIDRSNPSSGNIFADKNLFKAFDANFLLRTNQHDASNEFFVIRICQI